MFTDYFTAKYLLSKGALWNLALSDRSDGKTFDSKLRMLEDFKKDGTIGLYLRRYKTEITPEMFENFYSDVLEKPCGEPFRDWEFRYNRHGVMVKTSPESKFQQLNYFMPLTMAGKLKSAMQVLKIKTINYDEFVPLDGKYLPNEVELLLELWKSVDRDRDKVQLIILGNRITPFCPLLDYFDIELDITKEKVRLYRNGQFAVQIYVCNEHREKRQKSAFSDLVAGTNYDIYDKGGVLQALNFKTGIKGSGKYIMSFTSCNGSGSIWNNDGVIVVSTQIRKDGFVLSEVPLTTNRENYLITFGGFPKFFKTNYGANNLAFENAEAYHRFEPLLRKIHR